MESRNNAPPASPPETATPSGTGRRLLLLLVLVVGIGLRLFPTPAFQGIGFDEALYRDYLVKLDRVGLGSYPEICALYLETQQRPGATAKLPPTRFLYIGCAGVWKNLFLRDTPAADPRQPGFARRDPFLGSLKAVSTLFSILLLGLVPLCAHRMLGPGATLPATALMACSPVQIHMAQHALIDGFFSFWAALALWLLWESLQKPGAAQLAGCALSVTALVVAKENAFFVGSGFVAILAAAHWTAPGVVTRPAWAACGTGALLGVSLLALLAGGFDVLLSTYRLLVAQASVLPYAVQTGDGPWHRYLLDLLTVNPVLLCLAMAAFLGNAWRTPATLQLGVFVGASYLLMCNVRHGMNLRYTTIWDLPLCALAATRVRHLAGCCPRWEKAAETSLILIACLSALHIYQRLFLQHPLYELASRGLLEALQILK